MHKHNSFRCSLQHKNVKYHNEEETVFISRCGYLEGIWTTVDGFTLMRMASTTLTQWNVKK